MELHSETFNPADFAWRGLNAHASGGGTYSRSGGEKARDPWRAFTGSMLNKSRQKGGLAECPC